MLSLQQIINIDSTNTVVHPPVCEGPVGEEVQHLLVGVILAAEEDEVLQCVRQTVVVHGLAKV